MQIFIPESNAYQFAVSGLNILNKGHVFQVGSRGGTHSFSQALEPTVDETQGPGHGGQCIAGLVIYQLMLVPNYSAW